MTPDISIIDASYMLRQAPLTADQYMTNGKDRIDALFGDGYAAKHPELLAAFMRTAAQDFHTVMMKAALQDIRDALGRDCDSAVMTDEERAMLDALASPTPPA
jgi:hypothetical protein